ncbi:TPA: hypothetical protein NIA45_006928 [Pseudomonas aeruginosa]|nr:hypothetical protein [Pseudomonas aeruginosa]
MKTAIRNTVDTLLLGTLAGIWKVLKRFNPRPLQEYYAARTPANSITVERVFNATMEDAGASLCRVCNNLIKSESNPKGLFERNQLIKVFNPRNNHFAVLYVMGAGSHGIPRNGISLDYDARRALGIAKEAKSEEPVELHIGVANVGDTEYFHMYTDHDKSSRSARVLGWIMCAYGVAMTVLGVGEVAIGYVAHLFGLL